MKLLILKLAFLFLAVGLLGIGSTNSFLSDTETSVGNTFVAAESFCTPTDGGPFWASSVISSSQGLRKNGTPVLPGRSNPNDALGAPNGVGNPASGFFSLGFGGNIVLQFSSPVYNGTGADLSFHEITNSRNTYPLEQANVEVSSNGTTWYLIGEATSELPGDGVVYLDISSNASAPPVVNFIRITDTTNPAIHSSDADGYDLDAVNATNLCITPSPSPTPESTSSPSPTPTPTPTESPIPTLTPTITPTPIAGYVVINEVFYQGDPSKEWIELYNAGSVVFDLNGWSITDNTQTDTLATTSLLLQPGSFAVIVGTNNSGQSITLGAIKIVLGNTAIGNGLAEGGDRLILKNNFGNAVDQMNYGDDTAVWDPARAGVAVGYSLERSPAGKDTDTASDFIDQNSPSPGS